MMRLHILLIITMIVFDSYSQQNIRGEITSDKNIHSKGTITSDKYMHIVNKEMKHFNDGGTSDSNIHSHRNESGQNKIAPRGGIVIAWGSNYNKHPNSGLFRFEKHSTAKGNPN